MSFHDDVKSTPSIASAGCDGLQGSKGVDRSRLSCRDTRRIAGSVDLDATLRPARPNAPVWDYVVAVRRDRDEELHWIEVHPAHGGGVVDEVSAKLDWLLRWLREEAPRLDRQPGRFVWIASGRSGFRRGAPQLRALAKRGLEFVGACHRLD